MPRKTIQWFTKKKDANGNQTGKERIIIPSVDSYGKEIDDGNRREKITTHAYEIAPLQKMLKFSKTYSAKYLPKTTPI